MAIADEFTAYLAERGYDPRSSRHSDFLSEIIVRDLVTSCPLIGERAARGEIVASLRHHQQIERADWVIDIAIGTCAGAPTAPSATGRELGRIRMAPPVIIQIAIELKGVLTEHGKARRNRLRDFGAFQTHGHTYDPRTVVAAFLVVNSSDSFYSPLNLGKTTRSELNTHVSTLRTARQLAKESIDLFRTIHLRYSETDRPGLEALGVIVVEHDNIGYHPEPRKYGHLSKPTRVAPTPPSLAVGDPLSYDSMIQRICEHYTVRFAGRGVR
ncbi:MAG: hypothetical protein ACREE9_12860 [Stellaceae bacterium]